MANSYTKVTSTGQATFTAPAYLSKDHITVYVDDVSVSFTWDSSSIINITAGTTTGEIVKVARSTPDNTLVATLSDGAVDAAEHYNNIALQMLYRTQEVQEQGTKWHFGDGDPSSEPDETDGDFYLNSGVTTPADKGEVWGLIDGTWTELGDFDGPTGPTGPTGPSGTELSDDTTPVLGGNLLDGGFTIEGRDVNADGIKMDTIETSATADQTDAEIEAGYNTQVDVVSQADAEAGIETVVERWTPERVKQAIDALASAGSGRNYAEYTAVTGLTTALPIDNTIPQNDEGTEILTATITPSSTSNRVRIRAMATGTVSVAGPAAMALFVDSDAGALVAVHDQFTNQAGALVLEYEYAPSTTNELTFKIRAGPSANTLQINSDDTTGTRVFGGVNKATLIVEEIVP